jgi:3-hydroxyacyl-CoA dehydrogenase/enoyl-CoA hydratase/3-hydroxybutyryl-CoA epimerase
MESEAHRHWSWHLDESQVAHLIFDREDASVNTLSQDALEELDRCLSSLREDERVQGLIVLSGKASGFILGADVSEFSRVRSAALGSRLARRGQEILGRLASLPFRTVAAINGFALGGGLELALACDHRVAVKGYDRNIGLPEVQLGIHPGFGGTVRAVKLLGAPLALDIMLTGRSLSPVEALNAGLVDRLAGAEALADVCREILAHPPSRKRPGWFARLMNLRLVRPILAKKVAADVAKRARRDHYPAPWAILDLWRTHGGNGPAAYDAEADSIGALFETQTCRNLVRVFELRERLKNLAGKSDPIERVQVIGAGVMGGDIASWCASRGLEVLLTDLAEAAIDDARARASEFFRKRLKAPGAADAAYQRLRVDAEKAVSSDADLVVEAIVEKLDAKRTVLAEIESNVQPETIIASNTSSIMIERMAEALNTPGRFLGLHFFNPVAKLPLVEVVVGKQTAPDTVERATAFVTQIGKLPLPCSSAPGFLVNRVLTPYMLEALRAYEDGHSFEEIDAAALDFGMPMGPIELADAVGLDVALHVAEILSETLGLEPPAVLRKMVDSGTVGKKSGRGFYRYARGKAKKRNPDRPADPALIDRLILPMVNECMACLEEGVVEDADLIDAGVVFGTGFAPFRGGPVHYAIERGVSDVIDRLDELCELHGEHFRPSAGWTRLRAET